MYYVIGKKFVIGTVCLAIATTLIWLLGVPNPDPIMFTFGGIGIGIVIADFLPT